MSIQSTSSHMSESHLTEGRKSNIIKMLSQLHAYLSRYDDLEKAEVRYAKRCEELGCSDIYAVIDDVLDVVQTGKKADKAKLLRKIYRKYFPKVAEAEPAGEQEVEQAMDVADATQEKDDPADLRTEHEIETDAADYGIEEDVVDNCSSCGAPLTSQDYEEGECPGCGERLYAENPEEMRESVGSELDPAIAAIKNKIQAAAPEFEIGDDDDLPTFMNTSDEDMCPNCGTDMSEFLEIDGGWECPGCGEQYFDDDDDIDFDAEGYDAEYRSEVNGSDEPGEDFFGPEREYTEDELAAANKYGPDDIGLEPPGVGISSREDFEEGKKAKKKSGQGSNQLISDAHHAIAFIGLMEDELHIEITNLEQLKDALVKRCHGNEKHANDWYNALTKYFPQFIAKHHKEAELKESSEASKKCPNCGGDEDDVYIDETDGLRCAGCHTQVLSSGDIKDYGLDVSSFKKRAYKEASNKEADDEEVDWDDIPFNLQKKIAKLEKMIDPDGDGGLLEPEERKEIQAELDKLYAPYVKKAAKKGKKNESVLKESVSQGEVDAWIDNLYSRFPGITDADVIKSISSKFNVPYSVAEGFYDGEGFDDEEDTIVGREFVHQRPTQTSLDDDAFFEASITTSSQRAQKLRENYLTSSSSSSGGEEDLAKQTALLNAAKVLGDSQDSKDKQLSDELVKGLVK